MKKTLLALGVLTAFAGAASAQSSVTLFGVLDVNMRSVKTGATRLSKMENDGISSSRFGIRGEEDLGNGLKAGFWLEAPISADTGAGNTTKFFNRRSTVSLIGNFGEIRLGRDFTPTYTGYADYDVFGDNGIAAAGKFDAPLGVTRDSNATAGSGQGTRLGNQIAYFLPSNIGGIYGRAAVAAGEGTAGNKYVGGRLGYAAGPFDVSGSYGEYEVAPVQGDDKFSVASAGASYDLGVVKLSGYYTQNKFANQKIASYGLGAIVPIGLGQIKAAYTRANASGRTAANANVDANDADQFALGYVYNLSKRTALYGTGVYVKNKAGAAFVATGGPTLLAGTDRKSSGAEVGIRHSF